MSDHVLKRSEIDDDTPLRLAVAAAIAYPDGSMTASGLRREAAKGRLVVERTAGKDYTTLASDRAHEGAMPQAAKGPRLHLRRARRDASGAISHPAVWIIKDDGRHRQGTGCCVDDRERAEQILAEYIAQKRLTRRGSRDPTQIPVADVIARYLRDAAAKLARPTESAQRARALLAFFGDKTLADVNGDASRAYAAQRSTDAAARRELEDLRAAINHHRREGLCSQVVEVLLPPDRPPRERWLTRSEAARLVRAAWRYREVQKGRATDRRSRQHIAKFILVALYTRD
jgi:hypothetical protein